MVHNIAIEIDGPDKTGKDLIAKYLGILSNYKYTINVRGILSQLVYNDKFQRHRDYTLYYTPFIVLLEADKEDHAVRCRIAHEPKINFNKDVIAFEKYANYLIDNGCIVYKYDTSTNTPFQIAHAIYSALKKIDDYSIFLCKEPKHLKSLHFYKTEDLKDEDVFYGRLT